MSLHSMPGVPVQLPIDEHGPVRSMFEKWCSYPFDVR